MGGQWADISKLPSELDKKILKHLYLLCVVHFFKNVFLIPLPITSKVKYILFELKGLLGSTLLKFKVFEL